MKKKYNLCIWKKDKVKGSGSDKKGGRFKSKTFMHNRQGRYLHIAKHIFLVAWNDIKMRCSNTILIFLLKKIISKLKWFLGQFS